MLELIDIRDQLREENLHDTEHPPLPQHTGPVDEIHRIARTTDGSWNDLKCPMMGAAGTRFGRNVPLAETFPDLANLMKPNPRVVSQELMTRGEFQPATFINLLAASWIQFMVHDWFVHAKTGFDNAHEVPLTDDGSVVRKADEGAEVDPRCARPRRNGQAAGLRQRELALVGRLADLRRHAGLGRRDPHAASTARSSRARKAACRSIRRASK